MFAAMVRSALKSRRGGNSRAERKPNRSARARSQTKRSQTKHMHMYDVCAARRALHGLERPSTHDPQGTRDDARRLGPRRADTRPRRPRGAAARVPFAFRFSSPSVTELDTLIVHTRKQSADAPLAGRTPRDPPRDADPKSGTAPRDRTGATIQTEYTHVHVHVSPA